MIGEYGNEENISNSNSNKLSMHKNNIKNNKSNQVEALNFPQQNKSKLILETHYIEEHNKANNDRNANKESNLNDSHSNKNLISNDIDDIGHHYELANSRKEHFKYMINGILNSKTYLNFCIIWIAISIMSFFYSIFIYVKKLGKYHN